MDLDRQLIKEVKNHEVLYNPNHSMYKDVDFKNRVWMQIGKKLIGEEDETTSVAALKVRWKSLRDAYAKERKYDMSRSYGVKMKPKKPWRWKKQMEFLAPFIQNRKELMFDSFKDDVDVPGKVSEPENAKATKVTEAVSLKVRPSPNIRTETNSSHGGEKSNPQNEEIDKFFRGIYNAVKSLESKNQLLVQKDIAALVMSYKLRELEEEDLRKG